MDFGLGTDRIRPQENTEDGPLVEDARRIAARLSHGSAVHGADSLQAPNDDPDFETLAEQVQAAINKNEPNVGLDRLHTFVVKYLRTLCAARGIPTPREKPLHACVGEYVKALGKSGQLESSMTERILKSSISTLEALNTVRNEQSLAHDNPILNYDESLLIFSHVASTIRFIKALEERLHKSPPAPASDDFPF